MQISYSNKNYFIEIPQTFLKLKEVSFNNFQVDQVDKIIFKCIDFDRFLIINNEEDYSRIIHQSIIQGRSPFIVLDKISEKSRFVIEEECIKRNDFSIVIAEKNNDIVLSFKEEVHYGTQCNGCGIRNIKGKRFRCEKCPNYDLCEKCEATMGKSHNHTFTQIKTIRSGFSFPSVKKNTRCSYNPLIFESVA